MRLRSMMMFASSALALGSAAYAQDTTAPAETAAPVEAAPPADEAAATDTQGEGGEIVVTARKREESLQDVPVAVTAVSGETIEKRGFIQVKDVAQLTPSLNVNSDSVGRVFIAVRGVGTTLVGTVQPGVGIFVDGVYQPNTAYLNNPLVDVARVEVLRGPQGTLYGKNTLGGALNVITRQPGNNFEFRGGASYAGPDNAWTGFASVSGPIIEDKLQLRVAGAHREQEGFVHNKLLNTDANLLNMDTLSATLRSEPVEDVVLTINGSYDWVKGGNIPYAHIDGATDYTRNVFLTAENTVYYKYRALNAKLEVPVDSIGTKVTLVGAFNGRDGRTPDLDVDFNAVDIARQSSKDKLETFSGEARFDTRWSDQFSTLFGVFYSEEDLKGSSHQVTHFLPFVGLDLTRINNVVDKRDAQTFAVYGNVFYKPTEAWEIALGLRSDHEERKAGGSVGQVVVGGTIDEPDAPDAPLTPIDTVKIESHKLLPKLTVTHHFNEGLMAYASVGKGFRGGGFNGPTAPFRTYKGDSTWTYELGSKYASADRRLSVSGAIFYNDYKDYIGLNQFVLGTDGGPVTVDLNTGDVESYGAEVEFMFKPVPAWVLTGGASYIHARVTDSSVYTDTTSFVLGSDRLPFQPDWNLNLNSDYTVRMGEADVTFNVGVFAKGKRIGASLSETRVPMLKSYALVNGAITYAIGGIEVSAFVTNAFNANYYESFIEKTTLANIFGPFLDITTGEPLASDLGIMGEGRRVGVRTRFRF